MIRRLRTMLWAIGAVAAMGYYFAHAFVPPRRTALGTETRMFGLGDRDVDVISAPEQGSALSVASRTGAVGGGGLRKVLAAAHWPPEEHSPRELRLHPSQGTWSLHRTRLRPVWSQPAASWTAAGRLTHYNRAGRTATQILLPTRQTREFPTRSLPLATFRGSFVSRLLGIDTIVGISEEHRAVFFEQNGALWRLDLDRSVFDIASEHVSGGAISY